MPPHFLPITFYHDASSEFVYRVKSVMGVNLIMVLNERTALSIIKLTKKSLLSTTTSFGRGAEYNNRMLVEQRKMTTGYGNDVKADQSADLRHAIATTIVITIGD